jgi:hypothetical protein
MHIKRVAHSVAILSATTLVGAQAPPPAAQTPVGPSTAYQRAAQLQARIMDFKAEPSSVQAGQPVTLVWSTENPSGVTIDPEIGRVTPRGSRSVSPLATTTYTLTVRGPNNQTVTRAVTVNVIGAAAAAASASEAGTKAVPRMPNGKPDFSGVYNNSAPNAGGARAAAGGRGAAAGGPAAAVGRGAGRGGGDAGPVLKPGAEKFKVVRGPNDTGVYADCMPVAPPQAFSVPYQFQIVQSAHHVLILHEYPGTFRIIPTDGPTGVATHPADPDPTWLGDSVGHWDGDTLVVDTVGFNDKTEINGYRHTEALHIVERFSRPTYDVVQYEATLEDPNVFAAPWKVTRTFGLRTDLAKIDEFVCEHNPDYGKFFEKK